MIDVFEDRVRNWILLPAESLLELRHGFMAAISILFTYFEGIQIYISGKDSRGSSKIHFIEGFLSVFGAPDIDKSALENMAETIYTQGRCGFFHDGQSKRKILYSTAREDALTITIPKVDAELDYHGEVQSIVINPARFLWCVKRHFDKYISDLRKVDNIDLRDRFKRAADMKWGLGDPDIPIGTTEDEFRKT
ncbi:MAG TPA: hypothetical protein VMW16_06065 [Sedimentisphaerales bacterium]|nr:hypothetical protein [Sedimentisphaerales bacterium]